MAFYSQAAMVVSVLIGLSPSMNAAAGPAEMEVIGRAVEALGGQQRVLGAKTLVIYGYGQMAYQDGGGNIASSPDAPQKWININGHRRFIDLEHGRMSVQQRNVQDFVFAYRRNMTGEVRVHAFLDGSVAFNLDGAGKWARAPAMAARNRRIDMLDNPLSLLRVALAKDTKLSHLRKEAGELVLDMQTGTGDRLVLAVDSDTHLPAWLSWVAPHPNFGDVRYKTFFSGYQRLNGTGLCLPSGYNTVSDFRNVVQQKLYVDKYELDAPAPSDLVAPPEVVAMSEPDPARLPPVEAIPAGKGIWYLKVTGGGNSTLFEFADHLVIFEAYGSEPNALAVIAKARATVPGKPLTHVIVSHHHIDHTGGLRAAVSEGLTVITNRQNAAYVTEVTSRPAVTFPDALGRHPRTAHVLLVDDQLILKDASMEVDIDRVTNNSHFSQGLLAYAPAAHIVAEGDLVDEGWDLVWWGNSYADSVLRWGLEVDKDLPVHGNIHSYTEVKTMLKQQADNAVKLCADAEGAGLNVQGCPVSNVW